MKFTKQRPPSPLARFVLWLKAVFGLCSKSQIATIHDLEKLEYVFNMKVQEAVARLNTVNERQAEALDEVRVEVARLGNEITALRAQLEDQELPAEVIAALERVESSASTLANLFPPVPAPNPTPATPVPTPAIPERTEPEAPSEETPVNTTPITPIEPAVPPATDPTGGPSPELTPTEPVPVTPPPDEAPLFPDEPAPNPTPASRKGSRNS